MPPRILILSCAVLASALLLSLVPGCNGGTGDARGRNEGLQAQSCMVCHNGSGHDDYTGPGLENPHPFAPANNLQCTTCHGGNPLSSDVLGAHVPPPPEIGDRQNWIENREAYFNRLTLTGIDKYPDYMVNGSTYTALDYLQFVNPSDLRVVTQGKSCGMCHEGHAQTVAKSLLATEAGILAGAMYAAGIEADVPESRGLHENTAVDKGFRGIVDEVHDSARLGNVGRLLEFPVFSEFDRNRSAIRDNPDYEAANLPTGLAADGSFVSGSPLANLWHEQVAFTCGDCHLGSAGANNRYGDFRGSGCSSCHMQKSLSGRATSRDPNINRTEPVDPDDIDEPELPHVRQHRIISRAQTLPSGENLPGIDDYACAGCHQGSNRTVMQYWGIRLDQNADVRNGVQYPANPVTYRTTRDDTRLFDPQIGNRTFNGRNQNQYLLFEDYDGDGRDDTPADVHYEAGMGCIDCHGSADLHGDVAAEGDIHSRMEQSVAITCESCHGTVDSYAPTAPGLDYDDQQQELALDGKGNPLKHVYRGGDGNYYLRSRLTGNVHYVPQTRDVVCNSGRVHPSTRQPIYSAKASYAMGRDDGDPSTGIGPRQSGSASDGFSHSDNLSCVACHASWTNTCTGCHLEGEYNTGNNFSNITGERIVFRERNADFVYQSPLPFQIGVDTDGKIAPIAANTDAFFSYRDRRGVFSETFALADRNGGGNNRTTTRYPALSHNVMMPHSIRGKVTPTDEGPRYCSACHLTDRGLSQYGTEYAAFRTALQNDDFASLDFDLLQTHFGRNTGNTLDSPLFVHMAAGLGSGLYLFDENGCPVNPLDNDDDRKGCDGVAPASIFDTTRVAYNLDRIVDEAGVSQGSNNHPMANAQRGQILRQGARNPGLSGPLGAELIRRLVDPQTGIVLDSWIDADGQPRGNAAQQMGGGGGQP